MPANTQKAILSFNNLTLGYSTLPAVHHLTASLATGTSLALIGPNGGGKTTLLKGIMGELKPLGGQILWPTGKVQIGYLPQQNQLNLDLPINVADFISLGLWPQRGVFKKVGSANKQLISSTLAQVGLADLHYRQVSSLSGGQKQRVNFARLLIEDADLLLLDEPFAAVDQATTEQLLSLMKNLQQQGKTLITVVHNLELVKKHFTHCLLLAREALGYGSPQEVLTSANLTKANNMQTELNPYAPWCDLD